jgi:hypothetical protein
MRLNPESLARASSHHPWRTVVVWVVLLAGSFGVLKAGLFTDALTNGIDFTNRPESKQAATLVEDRLRGAEPDTELVIVTSGSATAQDAVFSEYVGSLQAAIGVSTRTS